MSTERKVDEIIAEIDVLLDAGEDVRAEKKLMEAIAQYTEAEPDNIVGQSVLLNELGGFYRNRRIFDKGEEAFLKAKALLEETRGYACIVYGPAPACGCCACDTQGEKKESHMEIVYADESMTVNYATTLNNLAGLYRMSGQFQKGANTFDAAVEVYENCEGDVSPDYLASVYNNKGLLYLDVQDVNQARSLFLKAKEILEKGGDYKFALGTTVSNLGFASIIEKKISEAAEFFKEAKILFEEAGRREMARTCETFLSRLERKK